MELFQARNNGTNKLEGIRSAEFHGDTFTRIVTELRRINVEKNISFLLNAYLPVNVLADGSRLAVKKILRRQLTHPSKRLAPGKEQ